MQPSLRLTRTAAAAMACATIVTACAGTAQAAERLTLSNGFDLLCDHHALVEGRVRVFLKAAAPDYVELKPEEIIGVEAVADPAPEPVAAESAAVAAAVEKPMKAAGVTNFDVQLTADDLHQLLRKAGREHNVDEDLLASVVKAESNGHVRALSRAGARGLMQLMPGTAQQLGVSDSYQPEQNVRGGAAYLDGLLARYHDNMALALAAYNAGPEAVDRYRGVPPYHETQAYVARVIHEFNRRVTARRRAARTTGTMTAQAAPVAGTERD